MTGAGDLAAAARPRRCARPHSGEHGAPDSIPGSIPGLSRGSPLGRTRDVHSPRRAQRLGHGPPPTGHTPTNPPAAPTPLGTGRAGTAHLHHKPVRRPTGTGSCGRAGSGEEYSALLWEALRPKQQKEESDGRRRGLIGRRKRRRMKRRRRRRRTTTTLGALFARDPPSSWTLCSSLRRALPGR